ncbi:hypothetical protein [Paenibacillus sp. GCM10027626]|uniref:hypothetical protein n=1 Tax=Paenibacillus sp. GCM10027626 TaxID=3273411 RepID=UPI00363B3018
MPEKLKRRTLPDELMFADPRKWFRAYSKLPEGEQYDWIMETLDWKLAPDFFETLPFAECIFELAERKDPSKYAALIRKLRYHPDFHREEFQYFEDELAAYHLFLDEEHKAAESLRYYMEAPVKGIDQLIQLVQLLVYYRKMDLAVECARQTYEEIVASPELLDGAGEPFADLMFMWRFQQAYVHIKNGQEVDWRALQQELEGYDIVMEDEVLERNRAAVSRLSSEDEILLSDYPIDERNGSGLFRRDNMWKFVKQMHDRKQMDFPLGEAIWLGAFRFLMERKKRKRSILTWEDWFIFSERELEAYLARMAGGFFSNRQAETFAVLWGMPYVYDFLFERNVISEKLHINALRQVARLKTKMRNAYRDELWKYAFVDRWPAADYVEREFLETEDNEEDDLDLLYNEDDDYDPEYDDEDGDKIWSNPSYGEPLKERRGDSTKVKQKKKKARKEAKNQRKKNRK